MQPILKPSKIVQYNKKMGRVDLADQYTTTYCFLRKTLKWWRKLFFWEKLLLDLVGDFCTTAKRGRQSSSDKEQRLDGTLHIITLHLQHKHKDCAVCTKRKVPGGRKETSYICETCDRKPGLHVGECFKRYHTI
ncbi:unnamed protein product, partial [Heterotrigona itama]